MPDNNNYNGGNPSNNRYGGTGQNTNRPSGAPNNYNGVRPNSYGAPNQNVRPGANPYNPNMNAGQNRYGTPNQNVRPGVNPSNPNMNAGQNRYGTPNQNVRPGVNPSNANMGAGQNRYGTPGYGGGYRPGGGYGNSNNAYSSNATNTGQNGYNSRGYTPNGSMPSNKYSPNSNIPPTNNTYGNRFGQQNNQQQQSPSVDPLAKIRNMQSAAAEKEAAHDKRRKFFIVLLVLLLIASAVLGVYYFMQNLSANSKYQTLYLSMQIDNKDILTVITDNQQTKVKDFFPGSTVSLSATVRNAENMTGDSVSGGDPESYFVRFSIYLIINDELRYDTIIPNTSEKWILGVDAVTTERYYYLNYRMPFLKSETLFNEITFNGSAITIDDASNECVIIVNVEASNASVEEIKTGLVWTGPQEWLDIIGD